jgi:hypothetical protein
LEGLHQKPDQMAETRWEGQNFSEVVAPQEEEEGSDSCTEDIAYYNNDTVTRLSAPEDFIQHCRRESFKTYITVRYEYSDTSANKDNSFRNHIR